MASTTSIASNANPASGTSLSAQPNGVGRPATKPTSSMKASDGGRKQTASPNDGAQKRAPVPKAWTSTINPITQKNIPQPQQNGSIMQQKPVVPTKAGLLKESITSDKHAHDRLTFILAASTGLQASITTTSGEKFEGVLCGSTLESGETNITTKMTKRIPSSNDAGANGVTDQSSAFTGSGLEFVMTFEGKDIAEVSLPSLNIPETSKPQNGAMPGFRIDAEISQGAERGERPLQPWIPDAAEDVDLSLDSAGSAGWDQFEANNRLFGTNSTFDEHLYTTRIDRSAPSYRERERQAAKIAKEIEGTTSTNAHMREERGHAWENDGEDEEDKYSGVRRDDLNFPPLQSGSSSKYTLPARRAPTGQPTVAGAPVDPAIISAQLSRPDSAKSTQSKMQQVKGTENVQTEGPVKVPKSDPSPAGNNPEPIDRSETKVLTPSTSTLSASQSQDVKEKGSPAGSSISSQRKVPENATEDVENKLLHQFKAFAASEKMRVQQSQRTRATNDRQAKLRELQNFSESFKLRTPVPTDLVGILAKDPAKQEQIVEKARKEHEELPTTPTPASHPITVAEAKPPSRIPPVGKFDPSMVPAPIPDRQSFNRARQGYPTAPARNERSGQAQAGHSLRGGPGFGMHRSAGLAQDRRPLPPQSIPTPIPIHEGRVPPLGPMADQSGRSSPQRSSVHTPTSAVSTKFNAKASEFRPNAVAPAFTPATTSIAPSSPKPIEPSRPISGAASPPSFFGAKKPKPAAERPAFTDYFNPFPRMKREVEQQKEQTKKDYSSNGGIPPAYNTPPRWDVAERHPDRTYKDVFERPMAPSGSPVPSARSMPAQQIPYQQQIPYHLPNGGHNIPQVHTPHVVQHSQSQHPHNNYDEGHSRMHMGGSPQVFPSPRLGSGQLVYASPMAHSNSMQYGQPVGQYAAPHGGPSPMHIRQYPTTPQFMHTQAPQMGAPMMAHQQSSGPYMGVPQQQYPHMAMYSPNPQQAYPQHAASQPHSGYPSPSRTAPMMMHQGSQQGHHNGPHLYGMPGQSTQMGYGQYGQPQAMRGGYAGQHTPYGTSPGQQYHYPPQPQRAMSSGYGGGYPGKVPMQHMQPSHGPPTMNGAHQQAGYPPQDVPVEMAK